MANYIDNSFFFALFLLVVLISTVHSISDGKVSKTDDKILNGDQSDTWPDLFPYGEICEDVNETSIIYSQPGPFSTNSDCTIDMDVMQHLMELILEAYNTVTGNTEKYSKKKAEEDDCSELNFTELKKETPELSEECQALVDNMEQLTLNITDKLKLLIEVISIDPSQCLPVKEELSRRIRELTVGICNLRVEQNSTIDIIKKKLIERHGCYIERLRAKDEYITNIKGTLDAERQTGIASKLKAGMLGEAYSAFAKYNNNSFLPQIVEEAYAPEFLESVLYFSMMMTKEVQRMAIYNATSKMMRDKQHYITANIILFRKTLRDEASQSSPELQNLLANVTKYTKAQIGNWASYITENNQAGIKSIVEFGSPPWDKYVGRAFTDVLSELITTAYSKKSDNVTVIELIKFGVALRWNIHKYIALTEMYKVFNKGEDKLQVAFRIRDVMQNLNGPDLKADEVRKMFDEFIKTQMTVNVRSVVWHQKCFLRNSEQGYKYIYSGDINYNQDIMDRPVTTSGSPNGDRTYWKIEAFLENEEYLVRIRNIGTGEYLGSHSMWKEQNGNAGQCSTNVGEPCYDWRHFSWKIGYESGRNEEILLYHVGRKGYLYSDVVLIYLVEDTKTTNSYWKLECDIQK